MSITGWQICVTDLISELALEWDHFTWPSQRRWWCIRGQAQWLTQKVALYVRKVGLKKLPTPLKVLLIESCGGLLFMKHDLRFGLFCAGWLFRVHEFLVLFAIKAKLFQEATFFIIIFTYLK